jgi:hypothetical protein
VDEMGFSKSNEKFTFVNQVSPCGIQRLRAAAIEGVKIDYPGGREGLTHLGIISNAFASRAFRCS